MDIYIYDFLNYHDGTANRLVIKMNDSGEETLFNGKLYQFLSDCDSKFEDYLVYKFESDGKTLTLYVYYG